MESLNAVLLLWDLGGDGSSKGSGGSSQPQNGLCSASWPKRTREGSPYEVRKGREGGGCHPGMASPGEAPPCSLPYLSFACAEAGSFASLSLSCHRQHLSSAGLLFKETFLLGGGVLGIPLSQSVHLESC